MGATPFSENFSTFSISEIECRETWGEKKGPEFHHKVSESFWMHLTDFIN